MKYLIYCGPGIGDLILILPMARVIKRNDEDAYISIIMRSDRNRIKINESLLTLQNDIDDIDYYSMNEVRHMLGVLMHIGYQKYDYGFVLQYTDNENTSKWPCRIINYAAKKTCGMELKCKPSVKYDFNITRISGYRMADYPLHMLDRIGVKVEINLNDEILLRRSIIEEEFKTLHIELKNNSLISLVIGTAPVTGTVDGNYKTNYTKNWSYKSWINLAKKLLDAGYQVAILGGNKERKDLDSNNEFNKLKGVINLVGNCSITQSLSIICKSKLVIGADTGLMHCSGVLKIPSLTLFGCTDPEDYLPIGTESYWISANESCSPCFGTENSLICKDKICMKNLLVEDVYAKAVKIIRKLI